MANHSLRTLIGSDATKVGTFLFEFATPGIGQILKAAGADFAVLDMEHTGFGFETVRQVVRYMQAADLPLVVRVPSQSRHHISRALDTGADGVMVPIVSSVDQAKAVLEAAKYWPDGTRGVALGLAHERFAMRREPLLPRFAEQNARTAIILQVEDPRGAAAADEIAALPGVDMAAPFGQSLHVSGTDRAALEAALAPYRRAPFRWEEVQPSLEDVFIRLMDTSEDNFK